MENQDKECIYKYVALGMLVYTFGYLTRMGVEKNKSVVELEEEVMTMFDVEKEPEPEPESEEEDYGGRWYNL